PARQLPRLDRGFGGDVAAGLGDGLAQPLGCLELPLLAREESNRRVGSDRRKRVLERVELLLLPALDAVDDDEPTADRERQGAERDGDGIRRLALEHLYALRATPRLSQRPQPGAPLGDPAVVVAVDQIRRLERGHRLRV